MLYGALDYWSLFHISFGYYAAHSRLKAYATFTIAVVWEWLEYLFMQSGFQPLMGSTFGALGNPSALNSVADVAFAMLAWSATCMWARWRTNRCK